MKNPNVAITSDWLIGGGAERVVLELHKMFPEAPIYTSYATDEWRSKLDGKVVTGYLQHWPFSKLRKFIPFLRAWWFSHLDLSGYDLVISSSGAEAKGVRTTPKRSWLSKLFAAQGASENRKGDVQQSTSTATRSSQHSDVNKSISSVVSSAGKQDDVVRKTVHICYIHAPTHYYWSRYDEYMEHPGFPAGFNWLARLGLRILVGPLRRWDYRAAQRPHQMIANSNYTKDQIKKYYNRDSDVIFPPVDVDRFQNVPSKKRSGFVTAGRQTPYKRIDLAVSACTELELPLIVIGNGPDHDKLVKMAGPTVAFVTNATDEQVAEYFASAEAFIFPGLDDFGITPVEAMAAGTPVIAYKAGGALDYVIEGKTGLFFDEKSVESLASVLLKFNSDAFHVLDVKQHAEQFSQNTFRNNFETFLKI